MTAPTIQSRGDINSGKHWLAWFFSAAFICTLIIPPNVFSQDAKPSVSDIPSHDILTPDQWIEVRASIDRALAWLASQQALDGSFPSRDIGQPAVTALCALAFLSAGHLPGEGPYGKQLNQAIEYVLSCRREGGIITLLAPDPQLLPYNAAHAAIYNHAIGGLLLSEAFGMTRWSRPEDMRTAVQGAVQFVLERQALLKKRAADVGGWRYARPWSESESDMSVTSWQLLFLRSARNAGFSVPSQSIDEAISYVQRCYDPRQKAFLYGLVGGDRHVTRAMTGAGILSLSLAGLHQSEIARNAGNWLLSRPFDVYLYSPGSSGEERYFYALFYCSQAMFQLGGQYWERFYPPAVQTLLSHQSVPGNWDAEVGGDSMFGNAYTTALTVLALSTPYQLLPICQR